ncbi:protein DCL homolog, chloroplastic-like isoform X3 [Miscanthus floridulus]|uniref:protein DCL homolog, chloroplastic-like isoform X3 n=1 Tax=Miscanthus floridulus TaxID=154761 RepID=UPI0034574A12
MALSAALARTHLLRGSLRPAGFAAAVSPLSYRSHRQLCGTPTANEPSAAGPWDEAEAEIFRDVEPVVNLVKDIIHSRRYRNGGFLSPDEEKVVTEKLLSHHPRAEEKIGCGLDGIMVDRHPQFNSRCLFVVRTRSAPNFSVFRRRPRWILCLLGSRQDLRFPCL